MNCEDCGLDAASMDIIHDGGHCCEGCGELFCGDCLMDGLCDACTEDRDWVNDL